MVTVRLPRDIERRLDRLARNAKRARNAFAREAILRQIEDIEDLHLARSRLRRGGRRITLDEIVGWAKVEGRAHAP